MSLNVFDPEKNYTEEQILVKRSHVSPKPVIGISYDFRDMGAVEGHSKIFYNIAKYNEYFFAVENAGGHPFVLSYNDKLEEVLPHLDGLLIAGGRDLHPKHYNEKVNGSVLNPSDHRWDFNKKVMELISQAIPVFGICWGMQFLNVLGGGSLVQHIEDHTLHANVIRHIRFKPGSWFHRIVGTENTERCVHHQAVKEVSKEYEITGWDEVSESPHAFESIQPGTFRIGVQFHPEIVEADADPTHNAKNQAIFKQFIHHAAQFKARRPIPPNL